MRRTEVKEHLDAYKEGWRRGDAEMIMAALADDFVYDDPLDGRFTKAEFAVYLEKLFSSDEPRRSCRSSTTR
jgi:hypothetical protein